MTAFIEPDWPCPPGLVALSTIRTGGFSAPPWDSFNLGDHVGDEPAAVARNRRRLLDLLPAGTRVQWLQQVHGTRMIRARGEYPVEADACWTDRHGLACAVMTADCLPVLLCDQRGTAVAAAHAGWRGLCSGVLEAAVAALPCDAADLLAWLGPAIGPAAFEVGEEVRDAFLARSKDAGSCFMPSSRQGHYMADIYALARQRLAAAGVSRLYGGGECTFTDVERFFSYRRDGQTGRMATLVMLRPPS